MQALFHDPMEFLMRNFFLDDGLPRVLCKPLHISFKRSIVIMFSYYFNKLITCSPKRFKDKI